VTVVAAALWASLLGAAPGVPGREVQVRVLAQAHPPEAEVLGAERHRLAVDGATLRVDGAPAQQPFTLPEGHWTVQLPGEPPRRYQGALSVRAVDGELALVLALPLERYVAEVVAAETTPGTPDEALRAQAVVVRSFVLAQGPRHPDAEVCDLAHCQVFRGRGVGSEHRARARAAAVATVGQVLVLPSGRVAETLYHAACGGHTADPGEIFGSSVTGARAVPDTGCPAHRWEAVVPVSAFRRALGALSPTGLELAIGQGGYVVQVRDPGTGLSVPGDAVARGLDRALGWGAVRGGRFSLRLEGDQVRVRGSGLGHGLGLCQAGAVRRAERGESYRAILGHYFPLAELRPGAPVSHFGDRKRNAAVLPAGQVFAVQRPD
jgi:stage II sporulation protein D